jgi:hypothetical protein
MLFDCWVALSRDRKQPTICYLIVGSLYRATGDNAMARPYWSCRCSTSPTASPPPAPPTICRRLTTTHHRSPPPPPTFYNHPLPTTYRTLTLISSLLPPPSLIRCPTRRRRPYHRLAPPLASATAVGFSALDLETSQLTEGSVGGPGCTQSHANAVACSSISVDCCIG